VDLVVLAKEPRPGHVKTRLCPPCSPQEAAAVAEAALADTLTEARRSAADRVVLALDGQVGPWCPPGVAVIDQGTGTLAERLTATWSAVSGPALQIGMDTPQMVAGDLDRAMALLTEPDHDAVLGPACDGGWWAIGFAERPPPDAFRGIATSRSDTGARQRARLAALGLRVRLLPEQRDVDTWADARLVAAEHPATTFATAVAAVGASSP
jgi:glycosyltransferase A (GT-A) superfamily protein (DUF2064 family)